MGRGGSGRRPLSGAGPRPDRVRPGPAKAGARRPVVPAAPEGTAAADAIRCFVALQPDEAARERLDALARTEQQRHPSARRMRRENLHLTLAFIGALPLQAARAVAARLAEQPAEPFAWALTEVGAFGGARVLWAGGADARLDALAARSRALLDACSVRYDRKPFVAHVTLLRNLPRAAAALAAHPIEPPIVWQAVAPVLLESDTDEHGVQYHAVHAGNG